MKSYVKPRMAFFHDNRFITNGDGEYYSATGFTDSLFSRYLRSFKSVVVVARQNNMPLGMRRDAHDLISSSKVSFKCIERLSFYKLFFGSDRQHIAKVVSENEVSIIRLPSMIGVVAALEAKKQKKPYIIELVGCRWDSLWNYGKPVYKFAAPVLFITDKLIVRWAPYVMYVTSGFLQRRYPTKGRALACSDAELTVDSESPLSSRLKKIHSYTTTHTFRLGTVAATDIKYKGQQYVIKALADLTNNGYNVEYYLAGSGSSTYLRKLAATFNVSEKVNFLGPLPHKDIREFMEDIDVYVQPSDQDCIARVILEAFETACPTIGSSTGGTPELIDRHFIFKRKKVSDLVQKIQYILDKSTLQQQANRNYSELKKYYPEILNKRRTTFYEIVAKETQNVH